MSADPRKMISMKFPTALLARIDKAAGKGGRTRWLIEAAQTRLDDKTVGGGRTPGAKANSTTVEPGATGAKAEPSPPPTPLVEVLAEPGCQHEWGVVLGRHRCTKCRRWRHGGGR